MGFFSLLVVASMPVLQFLLIGSLGAFLASGDSQIFSASARRDINKIVFAVFTPSLIFASLAKTVTLQELISWWFMPFNIAITFFIGATLGWIVVKILRPPSHLEGLIVANCSAGNLGNLLLMIIPTLCTEDGSPFANQSTCSARGLSYVSMSMALGGIFIWTHSYSLMKRDCITYERLKNEELPKTISEENEKTSLEDQLGNHKESGEASNSKDAWVPPLAKSADESQEQAIMEPLLSSGKLRRNEPFCKKVLETVHLLVKELLEPPTIAVMTGFIVGAIPWLKSLIIGRTAPLRVIQDSLAMLGDGTLPSTTLILGGNLTAGLKKSAVKPSVILAIVLVRYVALPISGIAIVKAANALGLLPQDPLFSYVLLTQFSIPSAVSIGVMAQLFGVGQEESSVIFLWIYLVAALALTVWSTVFMYILT
ncbi:protein PIN-LIKES 7-like [Dendrobium catenatum]|uniref:protein PIN-LIKES 7-like n=1 Tax=Dendrobium catenatum TaxID=906689 RepID=UPI0009F2B650|nr:protein PIN-LIKES 7-like [Dendrobium catenatum]